MYVYMYYYTCMYLVKNGVLSVKGRAWRSTSSESVCRCGVRDEIRERTFYTFFRGLHGRVKTAIIITKPSEVYCLEMGSFTSEGRGVGTVLRMGGPKENC